MIERQVDGTVDLNDLNNAIKVPNTIDKMPDSNNKVPDKAEIVPDTMKKIPDSSDGMPDKTEKCRIVNRNNKFTNMYRKMALLLLLRRQSF